MTTHNPGGRDRTDSTISPPAGVGPADGGSGATTTTTRGPGLGAGRFLLGALQSVLCLVVSLLIVSGIISFHEDVPWRVVADTLLKQAGLLAVCGLTRIYDPSGVPRLAGTGPDPAVGADYARVERVLVPGRGLTTPSGRRITVQGVHNERIIRSPFAFHYQPWDEPRLHELRRRYHLDRVVAPAASEFQAMRLLRDWTRGRFRRRDYQPIMADFDALAVLDRDRRSRGETFTASRYIDPCDFFPKLYIQVLLSMGYQARLTSIDHGMVEVWSNQFRKWFAVDAELNHHFEKDGIPLNMVELLEENYAGGPTRVRIVRGTQAPGGENPTMAHLKVERLDPGVTVRWFDRHLDLVELRNDWMTNRYFRGHPARSELNSLVYVNPHLGQPVEFAKLLRPRTRRQDEFYWTLNQTEILARRRVGEGIDLAFRTVTPNFAYFEVLVDGRVRCRTQSPAFRWGPHEGRNTLVVRTVNRFGVPGINSSLELSLSAAGSAPGPEGATADRPSRGASPGAPAGRSSDEPA
jgi:hypothetical protein